MSDEEKKVVWYVRCGLCGLVYPEPYDRYVEPKMARALLGGMCLRLANGNGAGASGYVHECQNLQGGFGLATVVGYRLEAQHVEERKDMAG
jgi:hypothetical protein